MALFFLLAFRLGLLRMNGDGEDGGGWARVRRFAFAADFIILFIFLGSDAFFWEV